MPTYQYACMNADCGNQFDLVQSFTDPLASECPVCDGPVRKVFSAVGVVFKGTGFYRTDSRAADKASVKPSAAPASAEFSSKSTETGPSSPTPSASPSAAPASGSAAPAKTAASA